MTIKVGGKVRYTGPNIWDLTPGRVYEVFGVFKGGVEVFDDVGDENYLIASEYELVTNTPALPPIWNDMNDAEKSALLLAKHEGKAIEYYDIHLSSWLVDHGFDPQQNPDVRYRVAEPAPKKPREWLIGMDTMHVQSVPSGFEPDGSASDYVHVREVLKD